MPRLTGGRCKTRLEDPTEEGEMANLIAVSYPDRATAEQVRDELLEMTKEKILELDDVVVITRDSSGKIDLHQPSRAGAGATGGALMGGLIGLLFFAPLLGMAFGAAGGALGGALSHGPVHEDFMRQLGDKLQPGKAALVVLVRKSTPDKVLPRLGNHDGQVLQTSLSDDDEAKLRAAVGD
jgi:uncharacterized membrane protein